MKNPSPKNIFAPWFILVALLLSFDAGALQRNGSMNRINNTHEQELKTQCGHSNDPNQAYMCLHGNESQHQTCACKNKVQDYTSSQNYVPEATEEPFTENQTNEVQ